METLPSPPDPDESDHPTTLEQLLLLAIVRLRDRAYVPIICRTVSFRGGRPVSRHAVDTTLRRMEDKGWLRSRLEPLRPGPHPLMVRHYGLQLRGWRALQKALDTSDRMRAGLPGLEPRTYAVRMEPPPAGSS